MTSAELATERPPYAGLVRRAVAILLDLGLGWAAYSIAITAFDPDVASEYATTAETVLGTAIVLAVGLLWLAYFVSAQWRWGQTLGMRAMGIRVVVQRGERVSLTRALLRSLALVVDVALGPLLIVASARRQRLGDRLANTVVLVKQDDALGAGRTGGAIERAGKASGARGQDSPSHGRIGDPGLEPAPPTGTPAPPPEGEPGADVRKIPATWGPARVAVGILVLFVLSLLEVGVVSIFDPSLDSLGARLVAQAMLAATLIGVAYSVAEGGFPGRVPSASLGLRRPVRSPFAFAAAAYVAYIVVALAYGALVHPHQKDITRDLGVGHGDIGTVIAALLIVVAAPISEEIFFRGFIFGGFRRRVSFPVAAILSAAIFGVFHYTGSGSEAVIPQLAFLGLAFAWVYEETGSIYPTIALHMLNNAFAFVVLTS